MIRIFVTGMLCLHLMFFANVRERILRGYPDFTVFYTAGTILRQGLRHQLYDPHIQYRVQQAFTGGLIESRRGPLPYIHPPLEAVIFLPLTLLPYREAFVAWDLLNIAALLGVAITLRRDLNVLRAIPAWEFVLGFLAFFPVFLCLLQGQDSILLLLLCALGFSALKRESDFLAGGWFGLALFKFQFVIPLIFLIAFWKRRRAAWGFAAVACVWALLSFALVGWDGMLAYPKFVLQIAKSPSLGGVPPELMPNLRGLLEGWSFNSAAADSAPALVSGLVLVLSIALLIFAALKGKTSKDHLEVGFSLAVVVSALISWHTNAHDLCLLLLPLVLLADYGWTFLADFPGRRARLLIPALPLLISPLWFVLWLENKNINLMAIPLLWSVWEISQEAMRSGGSRGVTPERAAAG
ncbi:MAG TPA: glycosyltransferase family 87 protein [Candidatus Sulfotelmatobacter sp.]|nr:glycosyltransferase family 87 protein [Candidatus Sulfotelmatobacter sp.]